MYLRLPVPQRQDAKPAELEGKGRKGKGTTQYELSVPGTCLSVTVSPGP